VSPDSKSSLAARSEPGELLRRIEKLERGKKRRGVLAASLGILVVILVGTVVVVYRAGPGATSAAASSAPNSPSASTSSSSKAPAVQRSTGVSPSTSATESSSAGAAPGVGGEILLKDLQRPGGGASGPFAWTTTDLAGTSTEGEAAYLTPCGTDAIKTTTFFKPIGYNHFTAQVGSTAQSPPTTLIKFEVMLDNSLTAAQTVEATLTSPQPFDLDLDAAKAGVLAIKATLLEPKPSFCQGGSARAVWSQAKLQTR
jgi:hypothetical protein